MESFVKSGASMTEINLITTPDGHIKAIDAKMSIDGNELFEDRMWRTCATCRLSHVGKESEGSGAVVCKTGRQRRLLC